MSMKEIIQRMREQAKQLTIDISQVGGGGSKTKEELHGDAIELLLSIAELETLYNLKLERNLGSSRIIKSRINANKESLTSDEVDSEPSREVA